MISERILQVGIFSCEEGKSHVPDVTVPFVFCRVTGSKGALVLSGWGSELSWAVVKAFKDIH